MIDSRKRGLPLAHNSPVFAANKHVRGENDVLHQAGKLSALSRSHRQLHHQVDDAAIIVRQVKAFLDSLPVKGQNNLVS